MEQFVDYYKVIGANRSDSEDVIKTKYRELAKKYHDDNNNGATKEAQEKLKAILAAQQVFKNPENREKYNQKYDEHYREVKKNKNYSNSEVHTQTQTQTNSSNKVSTINAEWIKFAIFQLQKIKSDKENDLNKLKKHLEKAIEIYSIFEEQQKKDYATKLKNIDKRYFDQYYYELKEKKNKLSQNQKSFNFFSNKKKQKADLNSTIESIASIEKQRQENVDRITGYFQSETDRRQADLNYMKMKMSSLEKKISEINGKISMLEDALVQEKEINNLDEILKTVKF
jgi:curved DNA-binding protein CbpA